MHRVLALLTGDDLERRLVERTGISLRLWYSLPFTSVVGGHVLIVDLDEQQRVIEKGEMSSP